MKNQNFFFCGWRTDMNAQNQRIKYSRKRAVRPMAASTLARGSPFSVLMMTL